jgi:phage baseplate assembly protein W
MSFQPNILASDMSISPSDGFEQVFTLKKNIKQNLKMLLLTNPGERVMDPNFGVGISRYLFEMMSDDVYSEIDSLIKEKVSIYMSYVNIQRVQFFEDVKRENKINMKILYSVPRISLNDSMTVNVT